HAKKAWQEGQVLLITNAAMRIYRTNGTIQYSLTSRALTSIVEAKEPLASESAIGSTRFAFTCAGPQDNNCPAHTLTEAITAALHHPLRRVHVSDLRVQLKALRNVNHPFAYLCTEPIPPSSAPCGKYL
ncbi:hypothetical protein Agub_g7659, partial [Astrephomene gubernaculifera]